MDGPKFPFVEHLKFDPSLRLSDENFAKKLKDGTRKEGRSNKQRLDSVIGYPETLDFARFASAAYQEWGENESQSNYEIRLNLPKGWKLLTTATGLAFKGTIYGYFGAAYWQPARRRVVIAHRGTVLAFQGMKLKNLDAVRADLMGIVGNKYVKQMDAACTFADKIRDAVEKVEIDTKTTFEIFFTGHSLGAWLAQVTTFSLKYLTLVNGAFVKNKVEGYHAHTVVFDSPGCKITIEKMIEDLDVRCAGNSTDSDSLDITTFLSSPNFVNCCNPHVGKVFRVYPRITSHDYVGYTKSSHSMKAILPIFQNVLPMREVVDWPLIKIDLWPWKLPENILGKEYGDFFKFANEENRYDPSVDDIKLEFKFTDENDRNSNRFVSVRYQTKPARSNECSFNVLNHFELEFIERFQLLKYIPNSLFEGEELSEEYKSKIAKNLNKLILNSKEKTIRCEINFKIFRLINYVKTLLRLYPELNERSRIALTNFGIRKQIYTDITKKYRNEMERLTNVLLPSDWPDFVHFLNDQLPICQVLAQHGTDSAMAKLLKVTETKVTRSTLFAFELRNLDTTEIFFYLTEFLKSSEKLSDVLIAIECEAGSFRHEKNFQLIKTLNNEIKNGVINIKLVLITDIKDEYYLELDNSVEIIHGGITWDELTNEVQTETISKNLITFQGNPEKISLQNFLRGQSKNINELGVIFDPETLRKFLTGNDVDVGPIIPVFTDIYVPRKLKNKPYIKEEVLRNAQDDDIVAVWEHSPWTISIDDSKNLQFESVSSNQEFEDICERNPGKNVHCLMRLENKFFIWHKTKGNLNLPRSNIRDESLEYSVKKVLADVSRKTLIISDAPGMGKSTVLAVLAEKMKKQIPSNWVIRIILNECVEALNNAIKNEIKLNNDLDAAKFLSEHMLPCSENTILTSSFERKLFEMSLTTYGGIVLIFDAFDEISPDYEEIVIQLLEILRSTRLEKIVLTTRPHTKERLEDQMATLSYTMVPFSRDDQKNFLIMFWKKRLKEDDTGRIDFEKRAGECVDQLEKSFNSQETDFLGVPLQCELLAEYTLDKINIGENEPELRELSLMELLEAFVRRKMNIYNQEKNWKTESNVSAANQKEFMAIWILKAHREYALRLVLTRQTLEELDDHEIEEKERQILDIEVRKAGLMLKTGENPQFVHRTFAEFFVLDYLFYMAEVNTKKNERKMAILARETLIQPEFGVLQMFLDNLIKNKRKLDKTRAILRSFAQTLARNWPIDKTLCLNRNGDTVFHVLLSSKNYSVFDAFLKMLKEVCLNEKRPKIVKSIIETPATNSLLPLDIASSQGHLDTVRSLVNHGVNVNGIETQRAMTPLLAASSNGHLEIVIYLLEEGAEVNCTDFDGQTPLHGASLNGNLEIVNFLLERRANLSARTNNELTPLHVASSIGHQEIVNILVKQGADINAATNEGRTALHMASWIGPLEIVVMLLEYGANIDPIDNDGLTPLHVATSIGNQEIIRFLIDNGADLNARTNNDLTPFHVAALNGHLDTVVFLVEKGANISARTNNGWNALHAASSNGHLQIVRFLFEKGVGGVRARTTNGFTPLHLASSKGHLNIATFLLKMGADISAQTNDGRTSLHASSRNGHLQIVASLLENGANINSRENDGTSPLYAASCNGHLELVRFILEKGADINARKMNGRTPLHGASLNGNLEVVQLLLENNADANSIDKDRRTPLHVASFVGNLEIVQLLLESGAKLEYSDKDGWNALHVASSNGHLETVRFLIKNDAKICARTNNGLTPLHLASLNGHLQIAVDLFRNGAEINARTNIGQTPLVGASSKGHLDVLKFLFEHGADINSKDDAGMSPLHAASWNGHPNATRLLVEHGADFEAKTKRGWTPIHAASRNGHLEIIRLLVEHGADFEARTNDGRTPIHAASKNGHLEIIRLLVEHGADFEARTNDGRTPIHAASKNGHLEIIRYLFQNGADINARSNDGSTPLYVALRNGRLNIVNFLVTKGSENF